MKLWHWKSHWKCVFSVWKKHFQLDFQCHYFIVYKTSYLSIYCVSLIRVTITRHVFINIFQVEQFSAVKFDKGYEKNISFLVMPKSQKVWKQFEKSDWAPWSRRRSEIANMCLFSDWNLAIYKCWQIQINTAHTWLAWSLWLLIMGLEHWGRDFHTRHSLLACLGLLFPSFSGFNHSHTVVKWSLKMRHLLTTLEQDDMGNLHYNNFH